MNPGIAAEPLHALGDLLTTLAPLNEAERAQVLSFFQPVTLPRETYFIQADAPSHRVGFIVSGILRMFYLTPQGDEFTKSFLVAGDTVAAYSALLLGEPSSVYIRAETDALLLCAEFAALDRWATGNLHGQTILRRLAEAVYIKKEKRERDLLLLDATTRYLQFRAEFPQLEGQVRQHQIASYLGITPVSLSRIRASLREAGEALT